MTQSARNLGTVALPLLLALLISPLIGRTAQAKSPATLPDGQRLAGPFTQGNLTIYLIRGPDTVKGDYLTLERAMRQKKVIVHETSNVNELSVENVGDQPVFIQAGDIVKGGKQDRCLGTDITLAPRSGRVAIAAFCVEHGRWTQRGEEPAARFSSSGYFAAGSKMKLAANANYDGGNQQQVWRQVHENQQKLARTVNGSAAASASPSSFQLTLENKNVQQAVDQYVEKLDNAPAGMEDAIGYVAAVNGKVTCSDSYGSSRLFRDLWPKLLRSAATEAAADAAPGQPAAAIKPEAIESALDDAARGKRTTKDITDSMQVTTSESGKSVMFESRDKGASGYLHRDVIAKD